MYWALNSGMVVRFNQLEQKKDSRDVFKIYNGKAKLTLQSETTKKYRQLLFKKKIHSPFFSQRQEHQTKTEIQNKKTKTAFS